MLHTKDSLRSIHQTTVKCNVRVYPQPYEEHFSYIAHFPWGSLPTLRQTLFSPIPQETMELNCTALRTALHMSIMMSFLLTSESRSWSLSAGCICNILIVHSTRSIAAEKTRASSTELNYISTLVVVYESSYHMSTTIGTPAAWHWRLRITQESTCSWASVRCRTRAWHQSSQEEQNNSKNAHDVEIWL